MGEAELVVVVVGVELVVEVEVLGALGVVLHDARVVEVVDDRAGGSVVVEEEEEGEC